jgi:thiamine pyrophosphate-dependent acetolactate synthase large subunit-like protein
VSRDVEYRLTIEPLKIADDLESLAADTARALAAVDAEAEPPGVIATRGAILEELVLRTLRLCKAFGIPVSSTASDKSVQASTAIRVLVAAGTVAGAVLAETTWRAYVSSALRREPTLK